jgi:hypothetical protein
MASERNKPSKCDKLQNQGGRAYFRCILRRFSGAGSSLPASLAALPQRGAVQRDIRMSRKSVKQGKLPLRNASGIGMVMIDDTAARVEHCTSCRRLMLEEGMQSHRHKNKHWKRKHAS